MFEFHKDKVRYFDMQYRTSKEHIIPFVEPFLKMDEKLEIMEIGCAQAGVLKAFLDIGHRCTGIELSRGKVKQARSFLKQEINSGQASIINKNIFDIDETEFKSKFDLIILKDVIEHLPNQQIFISEVNKFLKPNGFIFFGFPPWQMPFGGHQQMCKNRLAASLPYYHLLPKVLYKGIMKIFGESKGTIDALLEIKDYGISIEKFGKITKTEGFKIVNKTHFLINPIYKYKFNWEVRKQLPFISGIPYLRNFLTTAVYYLIKKN